MKNKEFYKDQIYEAACKYRKLAVNKETGEPCDCVATPCSQCALYHRYGGGGCTQYWSRWLEEEHIEPVLNEVEKKYLESVIAPFRKVVKYIKKATLLYRDWAYLVICVENIVDCVSRSEAINLPTFNSKKMYVGMEANKQYTLEELGLFTKETMNEE